MRTSTRISTAILSSGILAATASAQCADCTIDLVDGLLLGDCDNEYLEFLPENLVDLENGYHRISGRITPAEPGAVECRDIRIEIQYAARPTGWTFDLADSPTCNGWGGDAGTYSHAAEAQILDRTYQVYSEPLGFGTVEMFNKIDRLPLRNTLVGFLVRDNFVQMNLRGVSVETKTPNLELLFDLNDRPDELGDPNHDLFAAFNGVVSGRADRIGSGALSARIIVE